MLTDAFSYLPSAASASHTILIIFCLLPHRCGTIMFMVLSSWPKSLREFTRFIWWMQTERRVAANPSDLGCESAENCQLLSTSNIAIFIITQLTSWYVRHITSTWEWLWSILMRTSVCLSPQVYLPCHTRDLYQVFGHVVYGHSSVLLQQGNKIPRGRSNFGGLSQSFKSINNLRCSRR